MSVRPISSLLDGLQRLAEKVRSRIQWRAIISIIGISGVAGVLAIVASQFFFQSYERERAYGQIREMALAVEGTARSAAFTEDPALAHFVAEGLLQNQLIAKVVIRSLNMVLVEMEHTAHIGHQADAPLIRDLVSPVEGLREGSIEIYPEVSRIDEASLRNTHLIVGFLALELAVVAFSVAWVVFARVTRPIREVVTDLHHLKLEEGEVLWPPSGNESDEIGQLVGDVNLLIARMQGLLLTERDLREQKENSERKFRLIFENAETGIFVFDSVGYVQSWNPALVRVLGESTVNRAGMPPRLSSLLSCSPQLIDDMIVRARGSEQAVSADIERVSPEGTMEWFNLVFNPIADGLFQGVCNDISERKRAEASVRAQAERDALTGLLNRRGLEYRADGVLRGTPSQSHAIMQIDLDGFKQVNDTMGHETGDIVLCHVARQLEHTVRKKDLIARFGGDEFVVMLSDDASPETASVVAEKIVTRLREPIVIAGRGVAHVGASVGVVLSSGGDQTVHDLLRIADEAMYAVKRSGKNGYRIASNEQ